MSTPDLAEATAILAAQPFNGLVGARLAEFGDGRAEIRIPLRPDLLQQFGFAHGGLVAYAVDNALAFAAGTVLGASIVTRGFAVDYLRPGHGAELVARAHVVSSTRTQAACRCEVAARAQDGTESVVAVAQGTVVVIDVTRGRTT